MIKKLSVYVFTLLGLAGGFALGDTLYKLLAESHFFDLELSASGIIGIRIALYALCALVVGGVFFLLAKPVAKGFTRLLTWIESRLLKLPTKDLLVCILGLIIGLLVAYLLSPIVDKVTDAYIGFIITLVLYASLSYLGIMICHSRKHDFGLPFMKKKSDKTSDSEVTDCVQTDIEPRQMKLLDTSAIIDGRIRDIAKSGFVDGVIAVPSFVLSELQQIADNPDGLKRNRGRRGLDILKAMQDDKRCSVEVIDRDYDDIDDVDAKLVKLAFELHAKIITCDYNLNKVAKVQGVDVLNVNDLANAIKAVLIPGEEINVKIIQEGKEQNQGVAYLDDGTMIVVDGARSYIGQKIRVSVTSVLQTSAGRMIFAKLLDM